MIKLIHIKHCDICHKPLWVWSLWGWYSLNRRYGDAKVCCHDKCAEKWYRINQNEEEMFRQSIIEMEKRINRGDKIVHTNFYKKGKK